mgnify:CR=1 FL=1
MLELGVAGGHVVQGGRVPMVVEADKPGTLDAQRQVVVFNGNWRK